MNPRIFAVIAVVCSALGNVLIERHLSKVGPLITTFLICLGMISLLIPLLMVNGAIGIDTTKPQGNLQWKIVAFCSLLYLLTDVLYLLAYNKGAKVADVTTVLCLLPIFACLFKYLVGGGIPTVKQVAGMLLAVVSIFLIV